MFMDSGDSSKSLGIAPAAVGQIPRITEVNGDGEPTAWEAVDMPSGEEKWDFETIVELTEEVNSITVNTDENGNALALKEAKIFAWGKLNDVSSNISIRYKVVTEPIGHSPNYFEIGSGYAAANAICCCVSHGKVNEFGVLEAEIQNGTGLGAYVNYAVGMNGTPTKMHFPVHYNSVPLSTKVTAINSVEIYTAQGNAAFTSGIVKIIGKRA
jgi:hypothetical protein